MCSYALQSDTINEWLQFVLLVIIRRYVFRSSVYFVIYENLYSPQMSSTSHYALWRSLENESLVFLFQFITTLFVLDKDADNTAIIGIAVGVTVGLLCIAAVVIVIAILFYRYKVKNRYTKFDKFRTDYVTGTTFQITASCHRTLTWGIWALLSFSYELRQHTLDFFDFCRRKL